MIFLPIKPKFTTQILSGSKKVEFRKNSFLKNVDSLCLIYSSYPVKKIVGYFEYELDVIKSSEVFDKYSDVGGIDKQDLENYYKNNIFSYVLIIKKIVPLTPISVNKVFPSLKVPQSFSYLSEEQKCKILKLKV